MSFIFWRKIMQAYEIFTSHTLNSWEKYDFFLYAPHAGAAPEWLPFVQTTLLKNIFSDELLASYMKHEADIWAWELATCIFQELKNIRSDLKILLIIWKVPRAFCDLNRVPERAIPAMIQRELWKDLNHNSINHIEQLISNSKYWLHLHTMNSRNNTLDWHFWPDILQSDMENFLAKWYSGFQRYDNILTHHANGNYHSFLDLDNSFISRWEKYGIALDKNVAYKFENHFSATHLVEKVPSSLIEIVKGNLATDETKEAINASEIILDMNKIQKYTDIIVESIIDFFQNRENVF